jgi:hypothetical protein
MQRGALQGKVSWRPLWLGCRERRTLLQEMIAQKSKAAALREDGSFLMNRAILKVEYQMGGHAITASNLNQITLGYGIAIERPQHQKAVDHALGVIHGYLCRRQ